VEGSDPVTDTSPVTASEARAALGFVAAVREHFGFLADYGFREVKATKFIVDFDSEAVRMRIGHEPLGYELSANFARKSHPEEMTSSVSYSQYLRLVDPAAGEAYRDFAATTPAAVSRGVAKLAAEVRTATPLLSGDDATYDELAHLGMLAEETMAAGSRRHAYGDRAEAAWQAKDWPEVVAAYSRYEEDLTDGERRRLELARRRAAGVGS
jgi:hypothetical protein